MHRIQPQRGLTFSHGVLAGAGAAIALLAGAVLYASAGFTIGYGAGKYNTHDEFGPARDGVNGTQEAIDNDDKTRTLRLGYRHNLFSWLAVEADVVHLGVLRQEMRGRMPDTTTQTCHKKKGCRSVTTPGAADHRRTETSTWGIELTLQPQWEIFYLKTGLMHYYARHRMQGTLGDDARTVGETTGVLGGGLRLGRWRIDYTNYNHAYTRNSDLGGYYGREEYRNFHHVQAIRSF